jgi:ribulose bisphosphate carboxylase small subunit
MIEFMVYNKKGKWKPKPSVSGNAKQRRRQVRIWLSEGYKVRKLEYLNRNWVETKSWNVT